MLACAALASFLDLVIHYIVFERKKRAANICAYFAQLKMLIFV
jgi:hypothetical protein